MDCRREYEGFGHNVGLLAKLMCLVIGNKLPFEAYFLGLGESSKIFSYINLVFSFKLGG